MQYSNIVTLTTMVLYVQMRAGTINGAVGANKGPGKDTVTSMRRDARRCSL